MKRIVLTFLSALSLMMVPALAAPGNALAAPGCVPGGAKGQVLNGIGSTTDEACKDTGVTDTITAITNILSILVGAIAIIAIINGGFKYITSGGDATKVTNAKHTILYAIVGIAVVVLAQLIVRIVITETSNISHNCAADYHYVSASKTCVKNP